MTKSSSIGFGRSELHHSLVRRIERQFGRPAQDLVEPSLVIGVFGEWGSGKSYLLQQIGQQFDPKNYPPPGSGAPVSMILPIPFNPWRFEAEEHLIVPLLLTTRIAIRRWREEVKGPLKGLVEKAGKLLDRAEDLLSRMARAFASTLKFKVGIPGSELEIDLGHS